jgi:hypothetical protein
VILLNIDFEKLLSDHMDEIKAKYPNHKSEPFRELNLHIVEVAAKTTIEILKKYEQLRS